MTILWAGGEDTSGTLTGSAITRTGGSGFRTAFARSSLNTAGAPTTWPMTNSFVSPVFTPTTSAWYHGRYSNVNAGNNSTTASAIVMALCDSSGVGRILLRATGTAGQLKLSTRNAAGTITDLVTTVAGAFPICVGGAPLAIDIFVNYNTSGQATLYINGANVADTGSGVNVTTDSATQLAQVILGGMLSTSGEDWSELCVATTSTLAISVQSIPPVAAGNTQGWTPNTVADVNPAIINDANFVSTGTVNVLSEWTTSTSAPSAGSWTIAAVVQEARVEVGATGPQHFTWVVRTSDASDHTTGTLAPSTGFTNFNNQIWATNPHTSAAWNFGELINSGIESLT